MEKQHWIPSPAANPKTPAKQESQLCSVCPYIKKPAMGHPLYTVVALSTLCFVMLVTCIALAMLYNDESENKPEWKSLLFDYQNISQHYLTATEENDKLERDNQNLKQRHARLVEETKVLNRSLNNLTSINHAMILESNQLHVEITNLTSVNLQLTQDNDQLVQYSNELEEKEWNMSQSVARLIKSYVQIEEERDNLSAANTLLKYELFQAKEQNQDLLERHSQFQGEIQNLTERIERDCFLWDDCEEVLQNNTHIQGMVEEFQERNKNLTTLLDRERKDAAEKKRSRQEEMDRMLAEMRSMNEAFRSLDLYCPVVNQKTNERICKRCHGSWKLFQNRCYYFSSRTLTWKASRAWCQTQGGDLLIINTKQEQSFIFATGKALDQANTRIWIGMTDAEKEGDWHWVDSSPVTSELGFWLNRPGKGTEPDDWKLDNPKGEDCGHIDTSEREHSSWMDGSCDVSYRWICEKSS
ncbi:CD209 antigen-like [Lampris incognitus]|uniref:CD209 antigen-like n=1 Tax=Lampris incognitus TaxID=2546036 RepID=UPI0024B4C8D6|nr:CD209 antigen-like [Lampris incognitus]